MLIDLYFFLKPLVKVSSIILYQLLLTLPGPWVPNAFIWLEIIRIFLNSDGKLLENSVLSGIHAFLLIEKNKPYSLITYLLSLLPFWFYCFYSSLALVLPMS